MRRLILLLLLLCSTQTWSVCTVSTTNGTFGSVTSFALNATEQTTTANLIVACTTVLNLLTNDSVTLTLLGATATTTSNQAAMKRTDNAAITDAIPVRVCAQASCANNSEVAVNGSYTWSGGALLTLLGSSRYTLPLYFRTVAGQNVTAGPYQVILNFRVNYSVCALGLLGLCTSAQTGSPTVSTQLNLNVTNDCSTINAPNVNFGSAPLVSSFPTISQSIGITCTKGSTYTVGINNGAYASGNVRNMANGSNRLSYEIYKSSTSNRWGSLGSERWASSNASQTSSDGLLRTYNYSARVLPTQTTPAGGTYSDTLVIDIAF